VGAQKNLILLASILAALVAQPFVVHLSTGGRAAYDLFIAAVALGVFLVVFRERWERQVAVVLALPAVALTVALYVVPGRLAAAASVAYHASVALFLGFAVAAIVRDVFRHRAIGLDEIFGAFGGYILLGLVWGNLYVLVEVLAPGSFAVSADVRWQLDDWHLRRALFNYVSFATMTSLGYNDVIAVTPLANTLTWIEVMAAQFYLAVVIAQIVGLKLAQAVAAARVDRE
jgi:voltage-gated potassium channel